VLKSNGYLQEGNYDKAYDILKEMYAMTEVAQIPRFKWYYAQMRAAHLVSTEKYDLNLPSFDTNGIELSAVASDQFANALILLNQKKDIEPLINQLKTLHDAQKKEFEDQKNPGSDYFIGIHKDGIADAEIVILQLQALDMRAKGEFDHSYKSLEEAIKIEKELPLGYGPPNSPKPSLELKGDFLYDDKEFRKACGVFQEELLSLPNRLHSVNRLGHIDPNFRCPKKENIFFHRLMLPAEH
jgi:tetratricopeptide (TPR) repeat protein